MTRFLTLLTCLLGMSLSLGCRGGGQPPLLPSTVELPTTGTVDQLESSVDSRSDKTTDKNHSGGIESAPVEIDESPNRLAAYREENSATTNSPRAANTNSWGVTLISDQAGNSPSDQLEIPIAKAEPIAADPAAIPGGPRYPKQSSPDQFAAQPSPTVVLGDLNGYLAGNCQACDGAANCGPQHGHPLGAGSCGTGWRPEGVSCPWPSDEYLCDGGDNDARVRVGGDWTVKGLDLEDTVVHYDTVAGEVKVQPSNRVCVYSPRFSAVRRVDGLHSDDQHVKAGGYDLQLGPKRVEEKQLVDIDSAPLPVLGEIGRKRVTIYDGQDRGVPLTQNLAVRATLDGVKAAADFDRLLAHRLDEAWKPFLAKQSQAAVIWTRKQMVQVILEGQKTWANQNTELAEAVYSVEPGKPRLRITKAVSTDAANPGDVIQFVLRYDNIGEQAIGNVTLIDSLTTRLEYVANSQQSSRKARFLTTENHGESAILRWEIEEPLKPGEGGVVVFNCRVR